MIYKLLLNEIKGVFMQYLVSIIMPCYNSQNYIEEAIESVVVQTYENWELIIIDDCSKDNSVKIAEKYCKQDKRILFYKNEKNIGPAKTRNKGIELAKGQYIAFLDSDDVWHNEKLDKQISFLKQNQSCDLCSSSYEIIDENSNKIKEYKVKEKVLKYADLLKENVILCTTVIGKSELFKANQFKSDFKHEDFVLWLSLLSKNKRIYTMDINLARYRYNKGSRSFNKIKAAEDRWRILRENEKKEILKAFYYMCFYFLNGIKKYI
jgi:glycosyltransferase involved in cell wall biosynthesis